MEISKVVTLKIDGMNVSLTVDSDVDGEAAFSAQLKLPEVFSELFAMFQKKA